MSIQNIIVFAIVAICFIMAARHIYKSTTKKGGCGCGCSGCSSNAQSCGCGEDESKKNHACKG